MRDLLERKLGCCHGVSERAQRTRSWEVAERMTRRLVADHRAARRRFGRQGRTHALVRRESCSSSPDSVAEKMPHRPVHRRRLGVPFRFPVAPGQALAWAARDVVELLPEYPVAYCDSASFELLALYTAIAKALRHDAVLSQLRRRYARQRDRGAVELTERCYGRDAPERRELTSAVQRRSHQRLAPVSKWG
jgi:hypothetical protein